MNKREKLAEIAEACGYTHARNGLFDDFEHIELDFEVSVGWVGWDGDEPAIAMFKLASTKRQFEEVCGSDDDVAAEVIRWFSIYNGGYAK